MSRSTDPVRFVIFDLDGTLVDSKLDIAHAVNAAMRHLGLPELSLQLIGSYVGDGAPVLMRRALGPEADDDLIARGLRRFLEYYEEHPVDETVPYPGVEDTLSQLQAAGIPMAVLTNKPARISLEILRLLDLDQYFPKVYGGDSFPKKKPDPAGIFKLMQEYGARAVETLMVGDSSVDVLTARNAGIRSAGLTCGFAPASLAEYPPDYLLDSMPDLIPYLLPAA